MGMADLHIGIIINREKRISVYFNIELLENTSSYAPNEEI